jgi:hypothetical protein
MGQGFGSTQFTPPLPAGEYTFWIQELSAERLFYELDFQVTPVPVPAALWLFGSALAGLVGFGRRRKV